MLPWSHRLMATPRIMCSLTRAAAKLMGRFVGKIMMAVIMFMRKRSLGVKMVGDDDDERVEGIGRIVSMELTW